MSEGRIVEFGSAAGVFHHPRHAYTRALLEALPGREWDFERLARADARSVEAGSR